MKAAIYTRVSTRGQTVKNQLIELRAVAERKGWEVVAEYKDKGISGCKGRDERPGLDSMMKAANRKEFDVVMAWSIDRLGRSLSQLLQTMNELHARDIDLYLDREGIDTSTPMGQMIFNITGSFAQFERSMIQERVKAGMARAKKEGKRIGRPKVKPATEIKIMKLRNKHGWGVHRLAKAVGCGSGTVQRVLKEAT
jgi:DNA invertase Pin-like site-specific DNA recombinase